MKEKICVFAGTTEGRVLAEKLCGVSFLTVCVATDYGKAMLDGIRGIEVRVGRMDAGAMEDFIQENAFSRVLDATHPYASEASENIRAACERTGTALLRITREAAYGSDGVLVSSAGEAASYLAGTEGNILLTTGAKELPAFAGLDMSRVWARVLPFDASLRACEAVGLPSSHIIAMQGPFSRELNEATLRQINARWLVTKAAGAAGGFDGKLQAARALGITPIIIGRPSPPSEGISLEEALQVLLPPSRSVTLIGIGPGGAGTMTLEAARALENCDAVIGASAVLKAVGNVKPRFAAFLPEEVRAVLEDHRFREPAVVLRGDVGFYSAAGKLRDALSDYDVTLLPGIASPVCFAARLGIPWDDVKLLSLHGRDAGLIRAVDENRRVIALTGGENTVAAICGRLCEYGLGGLAVTVGERLSYPDERVSRGTARQFSGLDFDALSVILIENPMARRQTRHGIPDDDFLRGGVPMLSAEVRSVCLSKLAPGGDCVIWDIGAGPGPMSVECALAALEGRVYAVEPSPEGRALIRQNAVRFRVENITVVDRASPEALYALPAPTHVFLNGAADMRAVMGAALRRCPAVRFVAAVTPEDQAELVACARAFGFEHVEAVRVGIARSEETDPYSLTAAPSLVTVMTMLGASDHG